MILEYLKIIHVALIDGASTITGEDDGIFCSTLLLFMFDETWNLDFHKKESRKTNFSRY